VRLAVVLAAGASLAACASVHPEYSTQLPGHGPRVGAGGGGYKVGAPYEVGGIWYTPREQPDYDQVGVASWYGEQFNLKATANGEIFDMNAVTAAHTTLPLPSLVEVTNLDNGRKLVVRVNDRGPFVDNRIIDLSREAAVRLGFERQGLANVRVRYVGPAPLTGPADGVRVASNDTRKAPPATRLPPPVPVAPPRTPGYGDPLLAQQEIVKPPMQSAPSLVLANDPIAAQDLPPVTGSAISNAPIGSPAPAMAATPTPSVTPGLRIQAGAYSSQVNAQRAVTQLLPAGNASIETVQRDGLMLYRVVLPAPADEAAAYALRDRVAEIGFAEARVVRVY
jgi:rare lipoprotein A